MGDHGDVVRGRLRDDAARLCDAAAPGHVRLQDVHLVRVRVRVRDGVGVRRVRVRMTGSLNPNPRA